jgi:uncharacterized protein (UPF0335 family)
MASSAAAEQEQPEAARTKFGKDQLKAFVERIERLEEEIKALSDDKKDIYTEAKGEGFDVKILREVVRLRKQDEKERDERDSLLDIYMHALEAVEAPLADAA